MHTHMYVFVHIHAHTHIHAYAYTCIYIHTHVCTQIQIHCMFLERVFHIIVARCVIKCTAFTHTHPQTYIHTYIHICRYRFTACFWNDFFTLSRNVRLNVLPSASGFFSKLRWLVSESVRWRRLGDSVPRPVEGAARLDGKFCVVTGASRCVYIYVCMFLRACM